MPTEVLYAAEGVVSQKLDVCDPATPVEDLPPLREESPREEVTRLLTQIVHEYGRDHVYQPASPTGRCQYVHTERYTGRKSAGCIVGQLLLKATPEVQAKLECHNSSSVRAITGLFPLRWQKDERLMNALQRCQEMQDGKVPWGECLRAFKSMVPIHA